jgi:hypothetical protein
MADPLSIVGGLAAGLQLVSMAAEALLATIKLIKDLKEIPDRLAALLNEVDDSISRLCYSCNAGSKIFQSLDPPQMNRISRCAIALHPALEDIHKMLTPLFDKNQGKVSPVRHLWRSLVSLKIEKELPEKLQRLNRLNIEVIRELGVVGLETQLATSGLVRASGAASSQDFSNIEAKMDLLQTDFRNFTMSVQRVHTITNESPSYPTTVMKDGSVVGEEDFRKSGYGSSSNSSSSSSIASEATLCAQGPPETARVSQERAKQMLRYLSGTTESGTTAGLRVLTPGDLPSANLDYMLFSIRTFYTIGNFDSSPIVVRPKFWEDTDLGIYLMKVSEGKQRGASQSQIRGFRVLKASTAAVATANILSEGTASIIIELLSTLSPVNTTTCPYVREGMLQHLCELAREQLPPSHPIALVLNRLKNDNGDKNVTLRALGFIVERLRSTLGPIHPLTQLGTYRLCGLLRRSGDFVEALRVAGEGIQLIRALLGPGSLQERRLMRQLEHVYMDQCDWVAALSVCFDIVGQRLDTPNPDPLYHDECAVITMEDIAKTCECAGNVDQAVAWLKQASISGGIVWGQTEALAHIQDKLGELLKQIGKEDEFKLWIVS